MHCKYCSLLFRWFPGVMKPIGASGALSTFFPRGTNTKFSDGDDDYRDGYEDGQDDGGGDDGGGGDE